MSGHEAPWRTAITAIQPNEIRLRGYRIDELMGRVTFAQAIYLALIGELPSAAVGRLLDAILVSPSITARRLPQRWRRGLRPAPARRSTLRSWPGRWASTAITAVRSRTVCACCCGCSSRQAATKRRWRRRRLRWLKNIARREGACRLRTPCSHRRSPHGAPI